MSLLREIKWSASPQPYIFFAILVNIEAWRVSGLIVVHEEHSALLDEEKDADSRTCLA